MSAPEIPVVHIGWAQFQAMLEALREARQQIEYHMHGKYYDTDGDNATLAKIDAALAWQVKP